MKCYLIILCFLLAVITGVSQNPEIKVSKTEKGYIEAPFKRIDRLTVNNWWDRKSNDIIDLHVNRQHVIAFGLYTVSESTLKLTAQLFPLYPDETRELSLEIKLNNKWVEIQRQIVNDIGWSALFTVTNWDNSVDVPYRLRHGENAMFEGLIRKDPIHKDEIVVAALSCNSNKDRGEREKYVRNINHQNPDLIFFAGDQSYDHREHTAAWLKFGMQFRETFRERPCVTIPDDHDVGMYNLWGENGKKAKNMFGFSGGYRFHPEYVKMVERCQTGHLPNPYDPTPVNQGINVYYTNLIIGGVDFAIIEDRKFKSGPKGKIKHNRFVRPDHIRKRPYDPSSIDLDELTLLGDRQLDFLNEWANQKNGIEMKAVLSQTGFCSGAHLHGRRMKRVQADLDSNGWPQTGRNKALRIISEAKAVHIAGDEHLATLVQHGIDAYEDGPWSFVVPAIVNTIYSRWWWPEVEEELKVQKDSLPWTGKYLDGFGNKLTMHAYANPDSPSIGSGYGLIRFKKSTKEVVFECWPRNEDVSSEDSKQFLGWPITISLN